MVPLLVNRISAPTPNAFRPQYRNTAIPQHRVSANRQSAILCIPSPKKFCQIPNSSSLEPQASSLHPFPPQYRNTAIPCPLNCI